MDCSEYGDENDIVPPACCPAGMYQFHVEPSCPAASTGSINAPLGKLILPEPGVIASPSACAAARELEDDAGGSRTAPDFTPRRPFAPKLNCGPTLTRQPSLHEELKPLSSSAIASAAQKTIATDKSRFIPPPPRSRVQA